MDNKISESQVKVLTSIIDWVKEHGYSPTLRELSDLTGFSSISTIKHHLKKLQELEYIQVKKGTYRSIVLLQENLNGYASKTNGKQAKFINIWILNIAQQSSVTSAIEDVGSKHGYQIIITCTENSNEKFDTYYNQNNDSNNFTKGTVFLPLMGEKQASKNMEFIRKTQEQKIPIVVIDRLPYIEYKKPDFDYVTADNFRGGYLIANHLIELGHKRIAYIGGPASSSGQQRINGCRKAFEENGIEFDPKLIVKIETQDVWNHIDEMVKHLLALNKPPTAIFAECDFIAKDILTNLQDLGLKIPDDIALAGFDNMDFASYLSVPLTSVSQSFYDMGKVATEILLDKIEGRTKEIKEIILPVELIVRQSTSGNKNKVNSEINISSSNIAVAK
jgi:DNA-binding LacI/PurR family transcriptional regulator